MSSSPETLLELRDVDFGYGDRLVLSNLNMRFKRGQVVAVMGGSGCGKTTVLRLIGGLVQAPSAARSCSAARTSAPQTRDGLYALRRKMGMLFQFGALFTDHVRVRKRRVPAARTHRSPRRTAARPRADEAQRGRSARRARSGAVGDFGRHGAPRGAGPRHRARSRTDDVRRAVRRPRSHFARHHREPDPHAESGAWRHVDPRHARRAGIVRDCRLRLFPRERRRSRRRHAGRSCARRPDPTVRQFIDGAPDGPFKFHYPSTTPLAADFGIGGGQS